MGSRQIMERDAAQLGCDEGFTGLLPGCGARRVMLPGC